jgi:predicted MFS family arabinose efflux permease
VPPCCRQPKSAPLGPVCAITLACALALAGSPAAANVKSKAKLNHRETEQTVGLLQQASNLGQFAGPVVLGLWAGHFGWSTAPAIVTPAALVGVAAAFALRGAMHRSRAGQLTTQRMPQTYEASKPF